MDEYIKREDALEIVKRTCGDYASAVSEIRKLPAADVAEVKYGEWEEYSHDPDIITCSECDWGEGKENKIYKFCPMCGAIMRRKPRKGG